MGSEGSREPRVPPQNPALMPSALKGNFATVLTKAVTPDSVWDNEPRKVHGNSLSLFHNSIKTLDFSPRGKPY